MKKMFALFILCTFLLAGCGKAELEALTLSLEEQLAEKEEENSQLNDTVDELNEKVSDAEKFVQMLSDEKTELEKENEELKAAVEALQGPDIDSLMGYWMEKSYENPYFDVSVEEPEDWYHLNDEGLAQAVGLSIDIVNELSDINIESVQDGTLIPLFYVMNDTDMNSATANVLLLMSKALIKHELTSIFENARPQWEKMISSLGEASFGEIEDANIGGIDMKKQKIRVELSNGDFVIFENYYFYRGDYLGSLSATYLSTNETAIYEVLDTISFK